jgi:hypothetical protein
MPIGPRPIRGFLPRLFHPQLPGFDARSRAAINFKDAPYHLLRAASRTLTRPSLLNARYQRSAAAFLIAASSTWFELLLADMSQALVAELVGNYGPLLLSLVQARRSKA